MLKLDNISIKLGEFSLENISLKIEKGDYFVLLGDSGIGKSVLLEIISGMIKPDKGEIFLENRNITNDKIQKRKVGLVFQDQALFPHMDVYNNLIYGLKSRKLKKQEIEKKLKKICEDLNITNLIKRDTQTLSGGEKQRVALGRMLILNPEVLLLDEPFSSLDTGLKDGMKVLLRKINRKGQTILHVTHDYREALSLATKVGVIENKNRVSFISQIGTPSEVFKNPKSTFIAKFVGIKNLFKGKVKQYSDDLFEFTMDSDENIKFFILKNKKRSVDKNLTGYVIFESDDVTISQLQNRSSAKNRFSGEILDIAPSDKGVEVLIDIGVKIYSLISEESSEELNLKVGSIVNISFKASGLRFIMGGCC
jgi:molybdopterin-binding protein